MAVTRNDFIRAAVGFVTGGPLGAILSPAAGRLFNDNWTAWALAGVVFGPLSWALTTVSLSVLTGAPSAPSKSPAALPPAEVAAPAAAPAPVPSQISNTTVSDNLNAADGMFKNNMDGCSNVSAAISAANSPNVFGAVTAEQRLELKRYADRCGLRF